MGVDKIEKLKSSIWLERLVFFPIKVGIAHAVYANFENGVFYILAYILFCLGEQSTRYFLNTQELNTVIENIREHQSGDIARQNTDLFKRIEKLENQELTLVELDIRVSDLEGKYGD